MRDELPPLETSDLMNDGNVIEVPYSHPTYQVRIAV